MHPLPLLAAVLAAAALVATLVDPEHWVGDHVALVIVAYMAAGFIVFNWWELWSTRHER